MLAPVSGGAIINWAECHEIIDKSKRGAYT
jgi:hypothetical protein